MDCATSARGPISSIPDGGVAGGRQEERARSRTSKPPPAGATEWLENALLEERQAVQSLLKRRHDMLICRIAAQAQTSRSRSSGRAGVSSSACHAAEGKSCQPGPITQLASGFPDDGRSPESHAQCTIHPPGATDTDDMFAMDVAEAMHRGNSVMTMGFCTDDDDSKGANPHKLKDEIQSMTGTWSSACSTPEDRSCQPDPVTQLGRGFPDDGRSPESRALCATHPPGSIDTDDTFTVDTAEPMDKYQSSKACSKVTTDDEEGEDFEFRVSLDRTAGQRLGMQLRPVRCGDGGFLAITADTSGGLFQQWNSNNPRLAVKPGDRIVEVNGIRNDVDQLCYEVNQHQILELTVEHAKAEEDEDIVLPSRHMSFQSGKLVSSKRCKTLDKLKNKRTAYFRENTDFFLRIASSPAFEFGVAGLIMLNAIVMALDIQYKSFGIGYQLQYRWHGWTVHGTSQFEGPTPYQSHVWPWGHVLFEVCDWVFGIVFTCELIVQVAGYRRSWFKDPWNYLDAAIVGFWLLERGFSSLLDGHSSILRLCRFFRLLRLLRIMRTFKGCESLYLLVTTLKGCFLILSWSCLLLFMVQMLCAMLMWLYLEETYFTAEEYPLEERQAVFEYFGSFSRAMLTMFEMTLANWPPVCRLLVENVNEVFLIFCLIHKLTLGFAVVAVINGVFLQETFKVASTDDRIMIRQREQEVKVHTDRMSRLFEAADEDYSGYVDVEEFVQVMRDPTISDWLSAMQLPARDLATLYQLLDADGDGHLSCEEVVKGMLKMKGNAKSLDVTSLKRELAEVKRELREHILLLR